MNALKIRNQWQEEDNSKQFLPYDVIADSDAYHLVFNLPEHLSTHLFWSLNTADRKLNVVVTSDAGEASAHYPFSFKAPADADLNEVRIQSRKSMSLVSIAKVRRQKMQLHDVSMAIGN